MINSIKTILYIVQAVCLAIAAVLTFFCPSKISFWNGMVGLFYAAANIIVFVIIPYVIK